MTLVVSKPPLFEYLKIFHRKIIYFSLYLWYNINMDKYAIFKEQTNVTHGRGYVYLLQYHIVWVTKYRQPVLTGEIAVETKRHLLETMESLQMNCTAMEIMPDHIHLLVSCKPQLRLSDAIKILKGNAARWLFMEHQDLKRSLWGGHLWNPSYFVATVSERSAEQVEAYINSQKGGSCYGSNRSKNR